MMHGANDTMRCAADTLRCASDTLHGAANTLSGAAATVHSGRKRPFECYSHISHKYFKLEFQAHYVRLYSSCDSDNAGVAPSILVILMNGIALSLFIWVKYSQALNLSFEL